jgi:hypothetical protein
MRSIGVYLALVVATVTNAFPTSAPIEAEVVARGTGITATELESGSCRKYTFIFARGSGELGNMVRYNLVSTHSMILVSP